MAYVIAEPCVDVMDTACVDVCPVDCIHTKDGEKQLYINPAECIDCAACEPACPVTAIFILDDVPEQWNSYIELNETFFEDFVKPTKAGQQKEKMAQPEQTKIKLGSKSLYKPLSLPSLQFVPYCVRLLCSPSLC